MKVENPRVRTQVFYTEIPNQGKHGRNAKIFWWLNILLNPLISIKNKRRDISSEGYAAHPVRYNSSLPIIMADWRFFKFELAGSGVTARCRL